MAHSDVLTRSIRAPGSRVPGAAVVALGMLLVAGTGPLGAQQGERGDGARSAPVRDDDRVYEGSRGELTVEVARADGVEIDVDGTLTEPAWDRASILRGFTQFEPSEGIPAAEDTEVLVLMGRDAIHLGVRADDSAMDRIRATLAERDGFTRSDDYVRFILDTFDDQRKAYVFSVNPYGVQHDGLWVEGGGGGRGGGPGPPIDSNPDFVWESDATMADDGWTAEVRIPFKSLRFPDRAVQEWGFNVTREIRRSGFQQSWAPLSSDVANRLAQSGSIVGLRELDPGLFLEVNPVATGKRVGEYDEEADGLVHDGFEEDFGLNVTYGLTSNLTLDGTVNPDFSQVEADAGQIAVNERFALFFPEKRPFFLEGTEIFSLPKRLIYTRSIVDPIGGAKLTGKVGSLNVGYLGAVDRVEEGSDAVVNIARARQDVGESSTLGALYTDRTRSADDYNRVGGLDARFVLGQRYTLTLMGARSWTAVREADEEDGGPFAGADGAVTGSYLVAGVERAGRHFSFSAEMEDAASDFRAGSGFLRRIGDTQVRASVSFNRFPEPGGLVEEVGLTVDTRGFWDHDDFWAGRGLEEGQVELGGRVSFVDNVTVFGNWTRSRFDYGSASYTGLWVLPEVGDPEPFRPDASLFAGLDGYRLFFWVNRWDVVRGNVRINWREGPIFDRGLGVPVEPGESFGADVSLDLFPTDRLRGEVGLRHEVIERSRDGSRYSSATIPRVRVQYQFSRSLFLRTILEYSAQERAAVLHPVTGRPIAADCASQCEIREGSEANDFHVEGLLAYEPSPGTVFFVGYTRDMEEPAPFRFTDVEPRAEGLFVKLSYRFRF